jgi:hypothetical protein
MSHRLFLFLLILAGFSAAGFAATQQAAARKARTQTRFLDSSSATVQDQFKSRTVKLCSSPRQRQLPHSRHSSPQELSSAKGRGILEVTLPVAQEV